MGGTIGSGNTAVSDNRLVPNTWNEVVLPLQIPGEAGGAAPPDVANMVMFSVPVDAGGPKGDEEWTWYIDSLEVTEGA
jgi:hypothetical protein